MTFSLDTLVEILLEIFVATFVGAPFISGRLGPSLDTAAISLSPPEGEWAGESGPFQVVGAASSSARSLGGPGEGSAFAFLSLFVIGLPQSSRTRRIFTH